MGVHSKPGTSAFAYQYIYDNANTTYTLPKTRWINKDVGKVWDTDAEDLQAHADTPTFSNTLVDMTDHTATIGGWLIVVPSHANFIDGNYDMLVVENAASSTVVLGKHVVISGGKIVSMEIL